MKRGLTPCLFFGSLLLVALTDLVVAYSPLELPGRRFSNVPLSLSWSDFRYSSFGSKIEDYFRGRSVVYHGSGALYNEVVFRLTGRASGVFAADDGWLFLKSNVVEVEPCVVEKRVREAVDGIASVDAQMSVLGKQLYVVLIPNRGVLYPGLAYGGEAPPGRKEFLPAVSRGLSSSGVWNLDLTGRLSAEILSGRDTHFRGDHHWSYEGCRASAEAVAAEIKRMGGMARRSPTRSNGVVWSVSEVPPHRSLVSFLKFRKGSELETRFLHPQSIASFKLDWRGMTPDGEDREVLTMESSFGMFGFSQFLEGFLGSGVDAVVEPGNGSIYPIARFLSGGYGDLRSKDHRVVVWVLPQYHLESGLFNEAASQIRLPDPAAESLAERAVPHSGMRARGGTMRDDRLVLGGASAQLRVRFDEPVQWVKVSFKASGDAKRGILTCREAGPEGLLVFVEADEIADYWFSLDTDASDVEFAVRFPNRGYTLDAVSVEGFGSEKIRSVGRSLGRNES